MSVVMNSPSHQQLLARFTELRPLLLAMANEGLSRDIQAKVGASDIVQQTMLEAFRHMHTLTPENDQHVFHWLCKILTRNLKDVSKSFRFVQKRSIKREQRLSTDDPIVDQGTRTSQLEFEEDKQALAQAISRLPNAHQQILNWRFYQQLSFKEIADMVGRSEDAVRMQVNRAVRRLAREMNSHDNSVLR